MRDGGKGMGASVGGVRLRGKGLDGIENKK